ncbi:hypothetical protein O0544_04550 [Edwardsiella anguillarum]|nr:hypothetical protein [Edwardsiella anguillarum]
MAQGLRRSKGKRGNSGAARDDAHRRRKDYPGYAQSASAPSGGA